jgi:hypothetical protein
MLEEFSCYPGELSLFCDSVDVEGASVYSVRIKGERRFVPSMVADKIKELREFVVDSVDESSLNAIVSSDDVDRVINNAKEFVWERGNRAETSKIKLEKIPEAVKSGIMDVAALEAAIGKDVIELTGCSMEQALYFVGCGRPVLAATPDGVVIITGYDDYGNTILLNPGETETYFCGPLDSAAMFEAAGNHFVSYLETEID